MVRIPTVLSDPVQVQTMRPSRVSEVPTATADEFGGGVGAATAKLGASLIGLGVAAGDYAQVELAKRNEADAASLAAKFDFSKTFLDMQSKAGARPDNFGLDVGNAYDDSTQKYLDTIDNTQVREKVRARLEARREGYIQQANIFANRSVGDASIRDANEGINVQANRVRADGSEATYLDASKQIDDIINTRVGISGDIKEKMRVAAQQELAKRRFEGMVSSSLLDPQALEGIKKELTDENSPWKARLASKDYAAIVDHIDTLSKAANTQEVAAARSALQSVHQRNQDGVLIDPSEMDAVKSVVLKSGRPELMSQYAMIARGQQVYRDLQGLPLDQQRAKIEEMRKRGGITGLPEPVQKGITEGSALTNGEIGTEFLGGLVNAEYGHKIASGDYGQPTDAVLPNGRRASDAVGITQFTGKTWLDTLRAHATTLGIDGKADDATLLAMRKDPVLAIKAAALHALDNKRQLEGALGRPITDGDLYFAHFLGATGGARFLAAADASPNARAADFVQKEQVDANRNVFYDEAGKPRSLAQVRSFIANQMMNGPSRVDYAGVRAGELVLNKTIQGLKDDPVTFASTTGRFGDIGNLSSPEGIARRGVVAQQIAEYYGIPAEAFKPLTKAEVESLGTKARDGTADETLQVMGLIAGMRNPAIIKAANKQIGEKDTLYGYSASLINAYPDQATVAADIIRGEKRLKTDKDVKTQLGMTDNDISAAFDKTVGKAVMGTAQGSQIRQAAMAYYAERMLARGSAEPGKFDAAMFGEAIYAVLGGKGYPNGQPLANVNGQMMLLPYGLTDGDFNTALKRMGDDDYTRLSKWGGPPRYADGKAITADEIRRNGRFEAIGNGEYRIKMGDDKYALSGAYRDGSADFYIFRGDPKALREFIARPPAQGAVLPPVVPGVQPAKPRVIE